MKVLSVRFKVDAAIKVDEAQIGAAPLRLFCFCMRVGVRKKKKPRKNRGRHLQPLSFRPNVCGNQCHTTPGPYTFSFAHTSLKSYHFPHTFSLHVALSSGLQLQAGIWNLRWHTGAHACKLPGHPTLEVTNKRCRLCLKLPSCF